MIRIGIGGWNFEPWRGVFYPTDLPKTGELSFASERVTSIEINSTYYGSQKPATYRKWADSTPDDFVFSLKASRYATNRRVLAEAGDSIGKFLESGISEMAAKLGPILWQFAPSKAFDPDDFGAFLDLLPGKLDGLKLRHVVEVRHPSFKTPDFISLVRGKGVAVCYAHSEDFPEIADPTADFIYARLQQAQERFETGYSPADLDAWAGRVRMWADGRSPEDLPLISRAGKSAKRDAFIYFISGAKVRNPAAAMSLIARLGGS